MKEVEQREINIKNAAPKQKPPYLLGLLGLIPLVGFFVGFVLLLLGIIKYKNKTFTIIGIACMLFTILIYSSLYYWGFKSPSAERIWEEHAQIQLNSLIKDIEFYKLENGDYPDSLQQLENSDNFVFITDPIQTSKNRKNVNYNYSNLGKKYLLFSSGKDGISGTDDDIYPKVNSNENIGWIKTDSR